MIGKVKWFSNEKGYGFIDSEYGDIYVHYSTVLTNGFKSLIQGEDVEYELVITDKGYRAKNVRSLYKKKDFV